MCFIIFLSSNPKEVSVEICKLGFLFCHPLSDYYRRLCRVVGSSPGVTKDPLCNGTDNALLKGRGSHNVLIALLVEWLRQQTKKLPHLSEANPQVYVETPLHPEKLTGALYGLVESFKNDEGHNVTVNGDRYRAMITNFFIPELNNHDVQELWFQQDGATCHTARATID
ncbi:hypothetical protein TNCV_70841 [Trichonephila clavipes]|nr:hypothetical protein TNCV_70841 [Trichonephila clavipes]